MLIWLHVRIHLLPTGDCSYLEKVIFLLIELQRYGEDLYGKSFYSVFFFSSKESIMFVGEMFVVVLIVVTCILMTAYTIYGATITLYTRHL